MPAVEFSYVSFSFCLFLFHYVYRGKGICRSGIVIWVWIWCLNFRFLGNLWAFSLIIECFNCKIWLDADSNRVGVRHNWMVVGLDSHVVLIMGDFITYDTHLVDAFSCSYCLFVLLSISAAKGVIFIITKFTLKCLTCLRSIFRVTG